ncbi:MAG: Rrf2 family transcriptional regulator [Candidatus Sumerlaeaceae bacterium]|nr:Rrf2 family transcriptional regulator [Candidatus Sumerlaeaceae bacterium]
MLSLNQTTGYALLTLGMLEPPGGKPALVRDLARKTGIPKPYLSKMIHALASKGLLATKRGFRGGVTLARPADQITLIEVAQAVQGGPLRHTCLLGLTECSDERACPLHAFWTVTTDRIMRMLSRTTLAEAAEFEYLQSQRPPKRRLRSVKQASPVTNGRKPARKTKP